MKSILCAAVLIATFLFLFQTANGDEYKKAASEIGRFLCESASKEGRACFWPQYVGGPKDYKHNYPVSIYSGVAGTGYFLLNLFLVTEDKQFLDAAKAAGFRLVDEAKSMPSKAVKWGGTYERHGRSVPDGDGVGLYTGNAGISLFLMRLYGVTKEPVFKKTAEAGFKRILHEAKTEDGGGYSWIHSFQDIIGGEAGIGLSLLEMNKLTRKRSYMEAADKAGVWLMSKAEEDENGIFWNRFGGKDPNFSHGAAGKGFFLAALNKLKPQKSAIRAASWLEAMVEELNEDAIHWKYYGKPPEGKRNWVMNSWCHGAPGSHRLFLLLFKQSKDKNYLETARKAVGGIAEDMRLKSGKPFYYNPTYCCGAAGCLDAFLDLYIVTRDKQFVKDARIIADSIISSLRKKGENRVYASYDKEDETSKRFPYYGTGFMLGNAGIGYSLLRLHAALSGEEENLIYLCDHPFAH